MAGVSLMWAVMVGMMMVVGGTQGARMEVGGPAGWTLPSIGNVNYSIWAASQTFVVGDTLYFNYSKEYHNVMEVRKADYEACDASDPLSTFADGATLFTLDRSGTFYFLCGVPSHCTDGQKVVVKVRKHAFSSPSSLAPSQQSILSPSPQTSPPPLATSMNDNSTAPPAYFALGTLVIVFFYLFYGDSFLIH